MIVVDDSIVRGNTSKQLVKMLNTWRSASVLPYFIGKVKHPLLYGIDMSNKNELIANKLANTEAIREFLEVDSLTFVR